MTRCAAAMMLRCALLLAAPTGVSSFQTHDVEVLQAALMQQLLGRQNASRTSRSLDASVLDKQRCKSLPAPQDEMENVLAGVAKAVAGFECPKAKGCGGGGDDEKESGDPGDDKEGGDFPGDDKEGGDFPGDEEDGDGGPTKGDDDGPGKGGNGTNPGTFDCKNVADAAKKQSCAKLHAYKAKTCLKHPIEGVNLKSLKACSRDFGGLLRPYGKDSLGGFIIEVLKPLFKDKGKGKDELHSPGREIGKLVRAKIHSYYDFYLFVLGFIDGRNAAMDKNEKSKEARDIYNIGYGIGYSIYRPITDPEIEANAGKMIDIYGTLWMHFGFNDKHVPVSREEGGGKTDNKIIKKIETLIKQMILVEGGTTPKYTKADYEHEDLLLEILLMWFEASRLLHVDKKDHLDKTIAALGKWFGENLANIHHYRYNGANPLLWIIGLFDGVEDGKEAPEGVELMGVRYKPAYVGVKGKPLHKQRELGYKAGYRIGMGLAIGFRGDTGASSWTTARHAKKGHVFYSDSGNEAGVQHHYGRHSKIDVYVYEDEDNQIKDDDVDYTMKDEIDEMCKKVKKDNRGDKKCLWNSHYLCLSQTERPKDRYCPVRLVDSCQATVPVYMLVYAYEVPDTNWDLANCFLLIDGDTTMLRATESWNNKRRFWIPNVERSFLMKETLLKVNGFANSGCTYKVDEVC